MKLPSPQGEWSRTLRTPVAQLRALPSLRDSAPLQRIERMAQSTGASQKRARESVRESVRHEAPYRTRPDTQRSTHRLLRPHGGLPHHHTTTRRAPWRVDRGTARGRHRVQSMPLRFTAIALGSCLLFLAGVLGLPLGFGASTPLRGILTVLCSMGGLGILVLASLSARFPRRWYRRAWYRRLMKIRHLSTAFAAVMAACSLVVFAGAIYVMFGKSLSSSYWSDVISFSYVNAQLVLAGHNPYASSASFIPALQRFPNAIETPLRKGEFGSGYDYPSLGQISNVERRFLANPGAMHGEFDQNTLHSYPALSFLLYVPLIWAGWDNILLLHVVVFWALFAWLIWLTPRGWRHWGALAAGAALPILAYSVMLDTEIICIAFLLTAWHYRNKNWWASAILLGLGCAFKQYVWFFVPFFLLDAWLEHGSWAAPFADDFSIRVKGWRHVARASLAAVRSGDWGAACKRAGVTLAAFLAPNLPFIVLSPAAWFNSLWLPMSAPLFPTGMGFIALFTSHTLPYLPPHIFTALEALALLATLYAFIRWRPLLRECALLLALIPLFFAFRSLPNYFAVAPWLALYAVNMVYARQLAGRAATRTPLTWANVRRVLRLDPLFERMKLSLLVRLAAR